MSDAAAPSRSRRIGLWAGPAAAVLVGLLLPGGEGGLTAGGRATAATATLMAVWWLTEALPLAATALLPIALFPLLGAASIGEATAPYASKYIYLFMGGFMIAIAMQRWHLHTRFALHIVRIFGTRPTRLIAGFMIAAAALSMWISNTATIVMMLPIGLSVIDLVFRRIEGEASPAGDDDAVTDVSATRRLSPDNRDAGRNFATALMLGMAYASSIGGIGTIVGTPPNVFLVSFINDNYGIQIGFAQWMLFGVPIVLVFLPIAWLLLTRLIFPIRLTSIPGGAELIKGELERLGPMTRPERRVLAVFGLTALFWLTRDVLTTLANRLAVDQPGQVTEALAALANGLDDAGIAIVGALLMFLLPAGNGERGARLLDWPDVQKRLPWGVLMLFGGGLALADAMKGNGVAGFIGGEFAGLTVPAFAMVLAVCATVVFLTELTSNTATTTILLPVLASVAVGLDMAPSLLLVTAAVSASLAFMMPVATPPNAIVFGSGHIRISRMARAGFWLNLTGILIVTLFTYFLMGTLLGINLLAGSPPP